MRIALRPGDAWGEGTETQNLVMLHSDGGVTDIRVEADYFTDCPVIRVTSDRKLPAIVIVNGVRVAMPERKTRTG